MEKVKNASELESPMVPLVEMDRQMEDFADAMKKMECCLTRANEYYQAARVCKEEATMRAQVEGVYLSQLVAENIELTTELEQTQNRLGDVEHERDMLLERVADLQEQVEKRKFNVELRQQNEKLVAENEELKNERKKSLDWCSAAAKREVYDLIHQSLDERDRLSMRFGTQSEWIKLLDTMRGIFRRMPDVTAAIDALLEKQLNEPATQQSGMTVNIAVENGGTAQITDKEIINKKTELYGNTYNKSAGRNNPADRQTDSE